MKILCFLFGHICRVYSFGEGEICFQCLRCGKKFKRKVEDD